MVQSVMACTEPNDRTGLWLCREAGVSGVLRLEEVWAERLWGVVESLAVLPARTPGRGRDALLLTFRCLLRRCLDSAGATPSVNTEAGAKCDSHDLEV